MQNKSFVSLFAIVFAIVCLYQLSFTSIVKGIEEDAVEYSNGDEIKEKRYLDSTNRVIISFLFVIVIISQFLFPFLL